MKRIFKIFSVIIAAVMTAAVLPVTASADGTVAEAEQSVVLVASDYGYGSGFAVGKAGENPKYIVTNCHIVVQNGTASDNITVFFSAAANKMMSAEMIAVDTSKDLCILELPEATSERKPISLCKSENVSKGDEAYALGYPEYALSGKNYTTFDINDITSTKGSISQITRINNSGAIGTNVYLIDVTVDSGNSGGPLINSNGEVIGINTFGITSDATDGGYAVQVDELIPLLNSNSVPYTLSTDASSESSEDVPAVTEPAPAPKDNTTIIVIAIAAIVVIAAVVIVIVVIKSRKPAYTPPPAFGGNPGAMGRTVPVAPAAPVHSGGAVITGLKGTMANRSFNINEGLIIGRNPQKCSVCFPVDAKGVSGVHCQVRRSGGGYEIVDLGSSNGTFLGSGQRLTPNVPVQLPDGTYFYLGSIEQMFQIKY